MRQVAPPVRIRLKFSSCPLAVRTALAHILSKLGPLDLPGDDLGTIEIVLAEALNNVVEHAYPESGSAGPINIDCRTRADGLHVRIIDDGRAMPGTRLPAGNEADLAQDLQDLPEGGFGWFLILTLAQDVRYHREGDQNILNMRLPVSQGA